MYNKSEDYGLILKGRSIEYRGETLLASEVFAEVCQSYKTSGGLNVMVKHDPARMMAAVYIDPFENDCVDVDIITYQQFCNLYPNIVRAAFSNIKNLP